MKIIPGVGLIASAGAPASANDSLPATGGRRRRTNAGTEPIPATATTSWGRISVIVEDSAPPGVQILGRLARGTAGEARRVVHVFDLNAARSTNELVRTRCGEALTRAQVEWLT